MLVAKTSICGKLVISNSLQYGQWICSRLNLIQQCLQKFRLDLLTLLVFIFTGKNTAWSLDLIELLKEVEVRYFVGLWRSFQKS